METGTVGARCNDRLPMEAGIIPAVAGISLADALADGLSLLLTSHLAAESVRTRGFWSKKRCK